MHIDIDIQIYIVHVYRVYRYINTLNVYIEPLAHGAVTVVRHQIGERAEGGVGRKAG